MADSTTKTVSVDLAKQVFAICETNHGGQVIRQLELRRDTPVVARRAWAASAAGATTICARCRSMAHARH